MLNVHPRNCGVIAVSASGRRSGAGSSVEPADHQGICVIFIEFIRGVPLIVWLLFVAHVVLAYFLPPGTNFDLILRVIIMVTLFSAAYIAEVIRGGLAALPKWSIRGRRRGLDIRKRCG